MNIEVFTKIVVMALLLESLVQTVKPLWKPAEVSATFYINLGVALAASVGLNYLAGLDIFAAAGIGFKYPIAGVICTGLLMSRGANVAHDLINLILSVQIKAVNQTAKKTEEEEAVK